MRIVRVLAALFLGGIGVGLAFVGRPWRGATWCAALFATVIATGVITPWFIYVVGVVLLASLVDTVWQAARADATLQFGLAPWLCLAGTVAVAFGVRAVVVEAYRLPSSSMEPTIVIGDHVFVDKLSKHFRSPERGDVAVFVSPCDPRRDWIKRIVGLPGDTIEVRCHVLYVNGTAVPDELVAGTCSYDDRIEGSPWEARSCSRYRETLGDHTYEVFHDAERPDHDHHGDHVADARDFPRDGHPPPSCAAEPDGVAMPDVALGTLVAGSPASDDPCAPHLRYVVPADEVFVLGDNRANSNDSRVFGGVPISAIKGRATGIWLPGHQSRGIGAIP